MIFPKEDVVQQDLSTEYTDVADLLSTLKEKDFAGIVEVTLPGQRGLFLISNHKLLTVAVEAGQKPIIKAGGASLHELLDFYAHEPGTITVYRLAPNRIEAIAIRLASEIIFRGLTTDFVKLEGLIDKLKMAKHSGFIDVYTKGSELMGTLFMKEGELIELQIPTEHGGILQSSGPESISGFLDDAVRQGAVLDVYRSSTPDDSEQARPASRGRMVMITSTQRHHEEGQETSVSHNREHSADRAMVGGNGHDRRKAIDALRKVLTRTEAFVDAFSREGIFLRAFKRALIEKSEQYPFLDPFEDLFSYGRGEVSLDEGVDMGSFVVGIAESLNLAMSYLCKEFPKNMILPPELKAETQSLFKHYRETFADFTVEPVSLLAR